MNAFLKKFKEIPSSFVKKLWLMKLIFQGKKRTYSLYQLHKSSINVTTVKNQYHKNVVQTQILFFLRCEEMWINELLKIWKSRGFQKEDDINIVLICQDVVVLLFFHYNVRINHIPLQKEGLHLAIFCHIKHKVPFPTYDPALRSEGVNRGSPIQGSSIKITSNPFQPFSIGSLELAT